MLGDRRLIAADHLLEIADAQLAALVQGAGLDADIDEIDDMIAADVRLNRVEIRDGTIGFRCAAGTR